MPHSVTFLSVATNILKKLNVVDAMESLTLEQYRRMVDKVLEFKRLNGDLPTYAVVDGCRIGKREYIDMIERVNKFFLEMGRNPGTVDIGPIEDVSAVEKIQYNNSFHKYLPIIPLNPCNLFKSI
jgi:hypothetical protein